MHRWSNGRAAAVLVGASALGLVLTACSEDDIDFGATTVNVTLREFSVTPDHATAPAGHVTFDVRNVGEDMHEFLVIRTNLAPDALPTEDDGSYEEDGPGTVLLDEIEEIDPGDSAQLALDLSPGS